MIRLKELQENTSKQLKQAQEEVKMLYRKLLELEKLDNKFNKEN